jgi:hypothetical protein
MSASIDFTSFNRYRDNAVPTALEELRAQAAYQSTVRRPCLHRPLVEKILIRHLATVKTFSVIY